MQKIRTVVLKKHLKYFCNFISSINIEVTLKYVFTSNNAMVEFDSI